MKQKLKNWIYCRANTRQPWKSGLAQSGTEEALASGNHTVAEVDKWEAAHFAKDEIRGRVKAAKSEYEGGLRKKLFDF